jgi:hypothetical protein
MDNHDQEALRRIISAVADNVLAIEDVEAGAGDDILAAGTLTDTLLPVYLVID